VETLRSDAVATAGRRPDVPAAAGTSSADGPAGSVASATATEIDRLLSRVIERIRTVSSSSRPALEARLHDPELGTIRVLVAGRAGEVVRAELFVADQRIADAFSRAVDRSSTGHGLAGIDLRIRTDSMGFDAGATGSGSTPDRGGRDGGPSGWAGAGADAGGGFRGGGDASRDGVGPDRPAPRRASTVPPIPALARRGPAGGSLDIRA